MENIPVKIHPCLYDYTGCECIYGLYPDCWVQNLKREFITLSSARVSCFAYQLLNMKMSKSLRFQIEYNALLFESKKRARPTRVSSCWSKKDHPDSSKDGIQNQG